MQLAWPVHAESDQEPMLLEEAAPVVVEQGAVGLDAVLNDLARPTVSFNQFDRALEERKLHQRRLTPLPCDLYFRCLVGLQQLADVGLQGAVRHTLALVRIQRLLGQEEAIAAVYIAGRPAGLGQQVKGVRCIIRPGAARNGGRLARDGEVWVGLHPGIR